MIIRKKTKKRFLKVINITILLVFFLQPMSTPGIIYAIAVDNTTSDGQAVVSEGDSGETTADSEEDVVKKEDNVKDSTSETVDESTEEVKDADKEASQEDMAQEKDENTENDEKVTEEKEESTEEVKDEETSQEEMAQEKDENTENDEKVTEEKEESTEEVKDEETSQEDMAQEKDENTENDEKVTEEKEESAEEVKDEDKEDSQEAAVEEEKTCKDEWVESDEEYTRCVEESVEYTLDFDGDAKTTNDVLKITFTDIDEKENKDNEKEITIKEVKLTDEQVEKLGALSDTAYDITSTMKNGSFKYDLVLPLAKDVQKDEVSVVYVEDKGALEGEGAVKDATITKDGEVDKDIKVKVDTKKDEVKVEGLEHFTIWIVKNKTKVITLTGTVNGERKVTVDPNEVVTLNVSINKGCRFNVWKSTQYRIGDGTWQCINNPKYNKFNKLRHQNFDVTAPNDAGVYNIEVRAYSTENCHKKSLSYVKLTDAITVKNLIDTTPPTTPEIIVPTSERVFDSQPILNDWTDSTDEGGIAKYEIEYVYDDGHAFFQGPFRETPGNQSHRDHIPAVTEQGGVTMHVRAYDNAGNVSDWSDSVHYYYYQGIASFDAPVQTGYNEDNGDGYATPHDPDANEVACTGGYTNINGISVHWTYNLDGYTNLKYERQFNKQGSYGWTGSEIYTNLYTDYRTFGGNPGGEATYGSRVRAWIDENNDNIVDSNELTSSWSNECSITYDATAPAKPVGLHRIAPDESNKSYECGSYSKIQKMWPTWDANTEPDFDHYEYSSFNAPNGDHGIDERIFTTPYFHYTGSWLPNEGTYGFAVRAVDKAGNKSEWALSAETFDGSCQITYDDTAPVLTINSPNDNDIISGQFSVSGDVSDAASGIKIVKVKFKAMSDNSLIKTCLATYNATSNSYSLNVNDSTCDVPDDNYKIKVLAFDNANNETTVKVENVVIDNTAPVVDITNPSENGEYLAGEVTFEGNITEEHLSHYNLSLNPNPNVDGACDETAKEATWDFSKRVWQVDGGTNTVSHNFNTTTVTDGHYVLRLAARDLAGNRDPMSNTGDGDSVDYKCITIDNTAPDKLTGLQRKDKNDNTIACGSFAQLPTNSPNTRYYPDWDNSTDSNFSHYEYSSFNAPYGNQGLDELVLPDSEFIYTQAYSFEGNQTWPGSGWLPNEGTYGFAVRAVDKAGNKSEWALSAETLDGSCQITYDDTDPEGTIDAIKYPEDVLKNPERYPDKMFIEPGKFVTHYNTPVILGTATDNHSVQSVELSVNERNYTATLSGNNWEVNITDEIPDGLYDMTVTITDIAGNTTEVVQSIRIDTIAPTAVYKQFDGSTEVTGSIAYVNDLSRLSFTAEYTDVGPTAGLYQDSYVIFHAGDDGSFNFGHNSTEYPNGFCSWRRSPNLVHISGSAGINVNTSSLTVHEPFTNCTETLPDGEYYMTHQVYDGATRKDIPSINHFRDVLGLHFIVDTVAPVIDIHTPANAEVVTSSFTSEVAITDDNMVKDATVQLYNSKNELQSGSCSLQSSSSNDEGEITEDEGAGDSELDSTSASIQPLVPVKDTQTIVCTFDEEYPSGNYYVKVNAVDAAGNIQTARRDFVIDNDVPTLNQLQNQTFYEGQDVPVIEIVGQDIINVKQLCVTMTGPVGTFLPGGSIAGCNDSGSGTSYTWTNPAKFPSIFDTSMMSEGTYVMEYYVVDGIGHKSAKNTVTYTLKNVAPQVTFSVSDTDIDENKDEVTFTASFTDPSTKDAGDKVFDDAKWSATIDYGDDSGLVELGTFIDEGIITIPNHKYNKSGDLVTTLEVCESQTNPTSEKECTKLSVNMHVRDVETGEASSGSKKTPTTVTSADTTTYYGNVVTPITGVSPDAGDNQGDEEQKDNQKEQQSQDTTGGTVTDDEGGQVAGVEACNSWPTWAWIIMLLTGGLITYMIGRGAVNSADSKRNLLWQGLTMLAMVVLWYFFDACRTSVWVPFVSVIGIGIMMAILFNSSKGDTTTGVAGSIKTTGGPKII